MNAFWLVLQALGLASAVAGVYLLAGLGAALLAGGVVVAGVAEMRT